METIKSESGEQGKGEGKLHLKKNERAELNDLLRENEFNRISELKSFVSRILDGSGVNGTTAVYYDGPNGFRVTLFKGLVQSSMNRNTFLPSDKSSNLDDYEKISEILKQNQNINVTDVGEQGVYGDVPMFSKDKYVSPYLGINQEDSEIQKEKILNYLNGRYAQEEEDKTKMNKIKESIYSLFKKDK